MAPSRGKGKSRAAKGVELRTRRALRSTVPKETKVSDVYQELLEEAAAAESTDGDVDRPLKKRRVVSHVPVPNGQSSKTDAETFDGIHAKGASQTVEDSSQSEDEDESDMDFEDVDLGQSPVLEAVGDDDGIVDVSVTVDAPTTPKRKTPVKRKPASAAEKSFRLLVHKMHVLCLLGHCMYVNTWCNNEVVQRHLRPRLQQKTISYLNPNIEESQFQRNRSFMDGLQQASDAFREMFEITGSGMRKAKWPVEGEEDSPPIDPDPLDQASLISSANEMEGSQDTGNQLFCALLRSVDVDARLVCSIQPLSFVASSAKSSTPQKIPRPTVFVAPHTNDAVTSDSNTDDTSVQKSASIGKVPSVRRRLGQPYFPPEKPISSTSIQRKAIKKLTYPIFWVEAFNAAHQRWIPVDPIVTQSIGKPSKLEPPSVYEPNQLSYVIAFESNGVARDVTRRYARAYNAKTRRHRVETTDNGTLWLKKALRIFRRRGGAIDRDQMEDGELAQREAREGLPNNVQDFKDHPYYALERHLKRNEVIHPKREVGKVNAGTAAKPRMEVVYRRQDLHVCRSADKWFRLGRVVKKGEVALKQVPARRTRRIDEEDEEEGEELTTMALYATFQTEPYLPPPVIRGRVPRNAYGNLDIYVPSMVPDGGTHIRHQLAQQAAKILKIDYADAVTRFQFKGRHGTAVIEGAIVATQYADAVRAVIEGLEDERVEEESKDRSTVALKMWRRFLTGLRIAERVSGYAGPEHGEDLQMDLDREEDEQDEVAEAGGFFPGEGGGDVALPTAGRFSLDDLTISAKKNKRAAKKRKEEESEIEASFTSENDEEFQPNGRNVRHGRGVVEEDSQEEGMSDTGLSNDDQGGGFIPADDIEHTDDGGGSFLPDTEHGIDIYGIGDGGFVVDDLDTAKERSGSGFLVTSQSIPPMVGEEDQPHSATDLSFSKHDGMRDAEEQNAMERQPRPLYVSEPQSAANGGVRNIDANTHHQIRSEGSDALVNEDQDMETDHGSMLSHDPEDEDAEPDWLESDSN